MTNKPMLSVDRELLERAASAIEKHHGSLQWVIASDLRALLDKPVLESQYEGMTQDQAQAVSDGVDEILHGKPAAQHQGEPNVALCANAYSDMQRASKRLGQCISCGEPPEDDGVITHDPSCTLCAMEMAAYAEQTAPEADHPQCEECKGWGYHENHHEGGGTECGECGGSGNATVAVMPDVDELAQIIRKVDGSHALGAGSLAEAIIEEVSRLNRVKP